MPHEQPHDPADHRPGDPVDAIAAALAALRGRRRPTGPWSGPGGPGGPFGAHGHDHASPEHPGHGPHGGPFGHGMPRGRGRGGPPWTAGPRGGGARLRLLEALAAASTSLSIGEIAEAVGVDQPRASRLVQQCVDEGLARREADPDDARRTRVALTDEGRTLVRGARGQRREALETALAAFTEAEREELARLLAKLAEGWPKD
ncbi:MarR family winged helix-turn-helix transcriptional regulator [Microbacterium hominis]|uniref:MarR family winged helix-turn-helix transcriptional regulator n=1 Tax=Microbacterium hominis TaxID=162426 RepID=UPI0020B68164|nr:MarR family winged helix-turn-helix transcriptional regulator [Microbacterium hominis]